MSRTKLTMVALVGGVVAVFAFIIFVVGQPGGQGDRARPRPGPSPQQPAPLNAAIAGLGLEVEGQPSEGPLAPVRPVALSPAGAPATGRGGSAPVAGFVRPAAAPPPATCSVSLLQSVLGLVLSLVGGRAGC